MTPEQELAELKAEINRVWYLAYPLSAETDGEDAAKMRIYNLYQDLDCTRFNFRVLSNAYNEMEKKLNGK